MNLNWSPHIDHVSHKLVKANATHCKFYYYVNEDTIKSIYFGIFLSHFHVFALYVTYFICDNQLLSNVPLATPVSKYLFISVLRNQILVHVDAAESISHAFF